MPNTHTTKPKDENRVGIKTIFSRQWGVKVVRLEVFGRGRQYASHEYRQALGKSGINCGMSRKGDDWDHAVLESFFGYLKKGRINTRPWLSQELFEIQGLTQPQDKVRSFLRIFGCGIEDTDEAVLDSVVTELERSGSVQCAKDKAMSCHPKVTCMPRPVTSNAGYAHFACMETRVMN